MKTKLSHRNFLKIVAMVLVISLLSACGNSGTSDGNQDSANAPVEKVVMSFLCFNVPSEENIAHVEEAMNAITREKIGVEVELMIMDAASYGQQIPLMLAGDEQVDIFSGLALSFSSLVSNGYLMDLEENDLISTYGQGILDEMGSYVDGCRIDGVLYGLPQNRDMANINGYAVASEYLDGIGWEYDPNEFNVITRDQLEDMFAQLHEAYPEKVLMVCQPVARTKVMCDYPGGDWFGVLMDPENSLELSDLFSTPEYLEVCKMFYEWNQKGYISPDALTDSTAAVSLVASGKGIAYCCGLKPGIIEQESSSNGRPTAMFMLEEDNWALLPSSTFANMPWCMNSNTKCPEAAMKLLNEFYINAELSDILIYGVEGVDYVVNSEGLYTYPEGKTAADVYHPNVAPFMPNEFIAGVWEGNAADVWEQTDEMNKKAIQSIASGFTFDNSNVIAEYTALNNVYEEYRYQIEYGFIEPEAGIAEMVERMKSAGLDKYIAEKQAQLDAWAETVGLK